MQLSPEGALIFQQSLSTNTLRECTKTSLENFYVNFEIKSLKAVPRKLIL